MTKSITGKSPGGALAGMNFRVCAAAASSASSSFLLLLVSFSPSGFAVETNSRGRTASPTARLDAILPFFVHLVPFRYLAWPPSRPPLAARRADGPAGPAWRREGGPSVSSPATWPPRGEGGVEGAGAEEAGQREKNNGRIAFFFFILEIFFFVCLSVPSAAVSLLSPQPFTPRGPFFLRLCVCDTFSCFLSALFCAFFLVSVVCSSELFEPLEAGRKDSPVVSL